MRFAAQDFAAAQEYVRELGILSRKDQGCVEYWWAVSVDAPNTLRLFEVWESNDLLQQHLSQPHEKVWMEKFQPRVTDVEVFTYDPTTQGTIGG